MLVDKTEFEAWMERIMGELYRISRKLDKAETGKAPELPERRASVRQSGSMPVVAHQQTHAATIPE